MTLEKPLHQTGQEGWLRQASKSIFGLVWPWPLTFDLCFRVAVAQWGLRYVILLPGLVKFARPLTAWLQSWPFRALALWTTCDNWHQNQFIRLHITVFTRLVTDKWTNEQTTWEQNVSTCKAGLVGHKKNGNHNV